MNDELHPRLPSLRYTRRFAEVGLDDVTLVGGKNAALGELYRELVPQGVPVPNGFATTAEAYRSVLADAGVWEKLRDLLGDLDPEDVSDLAERAHAAREAIYTAPLPDELVKEILAGYAELRAEYGENITLAVRSSATAEDLPTAKPSRCLAPRASRSSAWR